MVPIRETISKLDRLRQQMRQMAEKMGSGWADQVAKTIGMWTDGTEQELLDKGSELFEKMCRDQVHAFRNDAEESGYAPAEQDIAKFIETARTAFHKRISEAVLAGAGAPLVGRA